MSEQIGNEQTSDINQTLKEYLDSVASALESYKSETLPLKEYLVYVEDTQKWLEEKCDEDPR